jgi:hypothetical protein
MCEWFITLQEIIKHSVINWTKEGPIPFSLLETKLYLFLLWIALKLIMRIPQFYCFYLSELIDWII